MPLRLISLGGNVLSFFRSISLKAWLIIVAVVIVLIILWKAESAVSDHFKYVHGLEKTDKDLTDQNTRLNTRVNDLADTNTKNQAIYKESVRQSDAARQVADNERIAAEARATKYGKIKDVIQATPVEDRHPVSSVVQSTIDQLYDSQPVAAGNTAGN